jgi:hypothetical protein
LQHEVDANAVLLLERERHIVNRLRSPLADNLPEVREQPLGVLERLFGVLAFVLEADLQPFVDVAGYLAACLA